MCLTAELVAEGIRVGTTKKRNAARVSDPYVDLDFRAARLKNLKTPAGQLLKRLFRIPNRY